MTKLETKPLTQYIHLHSANNCTQTPASHSAKTIWLPSQLPLKIVKNYTCFAKCTNAHETLTLN